MIAIHLWANALLDAVCSLRCSPNVRRVGRWFFLSLDQGMRSNF